jgi:hypothetical protein
MTGTDWVRLSGKWLMEAEASVVQGATVSLDVGWVGWRCCLFVTANTQGTVPGMERGGEGEMSVQLVFKGMEK